MPTAVMLAGDRKASMPILDDNKAFLDFRGEPMFVHVLRTLLDAKQVDSVVVVGPRERLLKSLDDISFDTNGRRIIVANQGSNLVENILIGHMTSLGVDVPAGAGHQFIDRQFDELANTPHRETPGLFLSCDIPLATSFEIDEFITGADMQRYDYAIGLSDELALEPFYPTESDPGIRMAYFHLAESRCRHNNLHFGKPLKATEMHNVERMYELRYQKKLSNIVRLALYLIRSKIHTFATLRLFLTLQMARSLGDGKRGKFYEWIRSKNRIDKILSHIGSTIGMKIQAVFTRYGGSVLDVDNADDLIVVEEMYDAWMNFQHNVYKAST